jgi:hypothetical protein
VAFRTLLTQNDAVQAALTAQPEQPSYESQLLVITANTPLATGNYRYLYTVRTARVGAAPNYTAAAEGTQDMYALSHSELCNSASNYSWGVTPGNLVAGFTPRPIPTNSFCVGVPHTLADGTFVWLLLNAQVIDGQCP